MEFDILREMIDVIRAEQQRRASLLTDKDTNFAYDRWIFKDEPFVNELCLMLLVTLNHQVERELVRLAALADDEGSKINGQQYQEKIEQLRKGKSWDFKEIENRLKLESCEGYKSMKALRLLANSYKHDLSMMPNKGLLKLLNFETEVNYASLPESDMFREGLSASLSLPKDAVYCDIAERFVDIANDFLTNVRSRTKLSRIKWGLGSFKPSDCVR